MTSGQVSEISGWCLFIILLEYLLPSKQLGKGFEWQELLGSMATFVAYLGLAAITVVMGNSRLSG